MTCAIQDAASPHEHPGSPLEVLRVFLKLGLTSFGGPAAHLGYFRNAGEIEALAGCDRLTISPQLLEALSKEEGDLPRPLHPEHAGPAPPASRWTRSASAGCSTRTRWGRRNSPTASRVFNHDLWALRTMVEQRLAAAA